MHAASELRRRETSARRKRPFSGSLRSSYVTSSVPKTIVGIKGTRIRKIHLPDCKSKSCLRSPGNLSSRSSRMLNVSGFDWEIGDSHASKKFVSFAPDVPDPEFTTGSEVDLEDELSESIANFSLQEAKVIAASEPSLGAEKIVLHSHRKSASDLFNETSKEEPFRVPEPKILTDKRYIKVENGEMNVDSVDDSAYESYFGISMAEC